MPGHSLKHTCPADAVLAYLMNGWMPCLKRTRRDLADAVCSPLPDRDGGAVADSLRYVSSGDAAFSVVGGGIGPTPPGRTAGGGYGAELATGGRDAGVHIDPRDVAAATQRLGEYLDAGRPDV